jgi:hypothetical protein
MDIHATTADQLLSAMGLTMAQPSSPARTAKSSMA